MWLWVVGLALAGDKAERIERLELQVHALEQEVAALRAGAAHGDDAAREQEAAELLQRAVDAAGRLVYTEARELLATLSAGYAGTRATRASERLRLEVGIVGGHPGEPTVDEWYTKPAKVADTALTLVVFFEAWCPHCQRELPTLPSWIERYGDRGLQVVGLTRLTRESTEEDVRALIAEHHLTFPIGHEDGAYTEALGVQGIPAAALIRDGEVVWRGHPAKLEDATFELLLPPVDP